MRILPIILRLSGFRFSPNKNPDSVPSLSPATWLQKKHPNNLLYLLSCLLISLILIPGFTSFRADVNAFSKKIKPPESPNLVLQFEATVHGQPLRLHEKYKNPFGETFEIDMLRFYAGKLTASNKGRLAKKISLVPGYHLIDLADSSSSYITLRLPKGDYDEIQFQLGIDSADQISGAQTGALDPLKGMFWTWNSGYISFKIEGISPESKEPAHAFTYHIGGYRAPNITVSTVKLSTSGKKAFHVNNEGETRLNIPIELDRFFDGPTPVHIRNTAECSSPGELAHRIFENFTGIFEEIEIAKNP